MIRFYPIWFYKLFYYFWNPILKQRLDIVKMMRNSNNQWLENREQQIKEKRKSFSLIKNNKKG